MNQQILSQDEVDALLQGITGESQKLEHDDAPKEGIRDYNLAQQERIVRGRMPTMEIINERFARNIRVGLFNFIRKSPEVSVGGIKVQKYSAFLREIVVCCSFTLEIGDTSGTIHFCIPYATLEPIRDVLFSSIQGDSAEPDRRWVKLLTQQIQSAEVDLVAELGHAPATVEQLLALKPGDFIELDLAKIIQAKIDGVPVFEAYYGTSDNKYALRVEKLLTTGGAGWLGDQHV